MGRTWAMVGLAMLVVAASPAWVSAQESPAGLSAPEWRQITAAIELEQERREGDAGAKHTESLYSLDQKLGPEPAIPRARFGYSVAIDGDLAVVGAPWASLAFLLSREPGGWELQQTLEGNWRELPGGCSYESWSFGYAVAIDGTTVVVGTPNYGCYDPVYGDEVWGNAYIFEETAPGSWTRTASMLGLVPYQPPQYLTPYLGSWMGISVGISGDTVIAGASGYSSDTGGCVVVKRSGGVWEFEELVVAAFPGAGDHFGRSLSIFGDTLVVGAPDDQVLFSAEAGRAYVFNRSGSTWTQTTELTAADPASSDHFGTSVSVVLPVILVGAPDDDHAAGIDAGSAYVFTESGGVWSQSQKLVALDGEADDRFGDAVALGWGVAVVGAPDDNHGMFDIDAGSTYVFNSIAGTWFQSGKLLAPDGGTSDHFGSSVAIWGTTAVVGSPFDDVGNVTNTGSVHFFEEHTGVWTHDGRVLGIREGLGKTFGYSVAVDGETMVVGVTDLSLIPPVAGGAYIFRRVAGSWELEWVLSWGDNVRYFGGAVAVSGDTVLVGAQDWGMAQGAVFVYTREAGVLGPVWKLEQPLLASDAAMGDTFGAAVAIDADTAVIGAPLRGFGSGTPFGAAYVFSRSGSVWSEDGILQSSDPAAEDLFGFSVDIAGDAIVAGAKGDDGGGENAGAAFVFRRSAGVWTEEEKLMADVPQAGAVLGHSVALEANTVVAGAPGVEVAGHPGAGAAHVFVESAGVWNQEQQLSAAVPDTDNFFGQAVAITGSTAVIGIPRWELHPHGRIGSAAVFYRSDSTWSHLQQLVASVPENDARFGLAIAATADGIVVAAPEEHFTAAHPGAVYWFEGSIVETDLSIAMDDGVTDVVPGTAVSYLTVVTNAGPNEAMGAAVSDAFPPELVSCTWTCLALGGSVCTPGPVSGDITDTVDLPVGGRLEYTADCLVASSATGHVSNTASVTAPPGVADTDPLNNSATDLDTLTPEADLTITKDNGVTQLIEGQTTTYTIAVGNAGPSDAPASLVTDAFPAELTDCSWACTPGAGAACTASGMGDIADTADLLASASVTYTATCTVAASGGPCSNIAEVAPPAGVIDPNPLDNDATDSDAVVGRVDVVYVSRILEGEVAVIDVQTDSLIRILRTGSNPAEVGIVTPLSRAFVPDLTDGTVSVIDTGDHGIEDVIDLGVPVATVGVDEAAQRVYALDYSNGVPGTDLHVIDGEALVELDVFTVGSRTQNIAVSATDDLAFVTDFDQGLNEIDTATGAVVRNLPMADLPHGVAVDDAADRLYVTRLDSDSVALIDTVTFTEIDSLTVGDMPQWIALDPPRAKAFITNEGDGTVSVIDTTTGTVKPTVIPVGPSPLTITIHESAAKAYVYNVGDGSISVIDTVGETVITTLAFIFADGFESGDTSAWFVTAEIQ